MSALSSTNNQRQHFGNHLLGVVEVVAVAWTYLGKEVKSAANISRTDVFS